MADDDYSNSEPTRNLLNNLGVDESEASEPIQLDLGVDLSRDLERNSVTPSAQGAAGVSGTDAPKREENPFSFKHFLRSDAAFYQNQGARPKVYCDGRPIASISDVDLHETSGLKQSRVVPEYSSALPDFVQDHLVVEQCYLGKDSRTSNYNLVLDNLPDFAPTSRNANRLNGDSSHDLHVRTENSSNNVAIPLDLPGRPQPNFPLDLPITEEQSSGCLPAEVGISKSLPDFLADGAVRNQTNGELSENHNQDRENDRLRQELELCRRQLVEQTRHNDLLQTELEVARNKEHEYTQNLAKALEQVEDNLERSNKRGASAENTISKLKQEIKLLKSEVSALQKENRLLQGGESASGGPSVSKSNSSQLPSRRLAQELRATANMADHSLRQLLTGVDNLLIMAATLENMHRIEDKTETFLNLDNDDGPAL